MPVKTFLDYPARLGTSSSPAISVVTSVRNGARTLDRTIRSIVQQDISDLEYIVVDGGSTDGTVDIIRAHADVITHWQSEPDSGISDGFNKGIALTRGRYITLVHSDDWLSPGQLRKGLDALEKSGADFVFGDLLYYHDGQLSYRILGDSDYARDIAHVMPALNHPTMILRREVYETCGLFDTDYGLAMDYELLLRLHRAGVRGAYDPQIIGNMSLAGASDRSSRAAMAEVRRASITHGYPAVKAWLLFGFRVLKHTLRRLSEKYLPRRWHEKLRHRVNRNFVGVP